MKNKLTNKTVRTITLLIASVILAVSFAVYINVAAAPGSKVESSLHITSGDPSVLEEISFNMWLRNSNCFTNYPSDVTSGTTNIMKTTVLFDKNGKPNVTHYSRAYEKAEDNLANADLWLTEDMKLMGYYFEPIKIPNFQIDLKIDQKNIMRNACNINGPKIGENIYFAISNADIDDIVSRICLSILEEQTQTDQEDILTIESAEVKEKVRTSLQSFSLTSGILRVHEGTMENILPIKISSDNNTMIFELAYLEQTNCLALSALENFNEIYVYIYHLETGSVDKHHIATHDDLVEEISIHEWMTSMSADDNLLIVKTGNVFACIETSLTNSNIKDCFKYDFDIEFKASSSYLGYGNYNSLCLAYKNESFYAANFEYYADDTFFGYKLNINAFKESALVFSGYILFPHEGLPGAGVFTASDEMPFVTEEGWAVKRWTESF